MTDKQIEKAFSDWYDSRVGMPPAAFESWKAGRESVLKNLTNGSACPPVRAGSKLGRKRTDEIVGG